MLSAPKQLLQNSVQDGQKRYATDGELAYRAHGLR